MSEHIDRIRERQQRIADFARNELMTKLQAFESQNTADFGPLRASIKDALPLLAVGFFLPVLLRILPLPKLIFEIGGFICMGLLALASMRVFPNLRRLTTVLVQAGEARQQLRTQMKREVVKYLDPQFQFLSQPLFPEWAYQESGLFPQKFDQKMAEDQCRGMLGTTTFQMTEVGTYKRVKSTRSDGTEEVRLEPLFRGIVLVADFNKRFKARTVIQSDVLEKRGGSLGKLAQRILGGDGTMNLVELENPLFEQRWKVMSSDPVEARYIITPRFMEQFLALEDVFGEGIQASFLQGKMVLAIPRAKDFFELEVNSNTLVASVENAAEEILQVLDVLDHFDLNLELWKVRGNKGVAA